MLQTVSSDEKYKRAVFCLDDYDLSVVNCVNPVFAHHSWQATTTTIMNHHPLCRVFKTRDGDYNKIVWLPVGVLSRPERHSHIREVEEGNDLMEYFCNNNLSSTPKIELSNVLWTSLLMFSWMEAWTLLKFLLSSFHPLNRGVAVQILSGESSAVLYPEINAWLWKCSFSSAFLERTLNSGSSFPFRVCRSVPQCSRVVVIVGKLQLSR